MLKKKANYENLYLFTFSIIFWLISHFFVFTNDFFVYDSVGIYDNSLGIGNGRFLISIFLQLTGRYQSPWVINLISSVFVSSTILIIIDIFKINTVMAKYMISVTIILSPICFFTNYFLSSAYIYYIAFFFSVLSVWYIIKGKWYYILAGISSILSLGCYQAYIGVTFSVLLLYMIFELSENVKVKLIIKNAFKYLFTYITSTFLYYIICKILFFISDTSPFTYRNMDKTLYFLINDLANNLLFAYKNGISIITSAHIFSNESIIEILYKTIIFLIFIFSLFLLFFLQYKKRTSVPNIFCSMALIFLYPLSAGAICFFNPIPPHILMEMPQVLTIIFLIIIYDKIVPNNLILKSKKIKIKNTIIITLCILSFLNVILGNAFYTKMTSDAKNAQSLAINFVDRVEKENGIKNKSKVCIVVDKDWYYEGYGYISEWKEKTMRVAKPNLPSLPYVTALIYYINDNCNYMELEYSFKYRYDDSIKENVDVQMLNKFPAQDCCVWVDDTLFVRL